MNADINLSANNKNKKRAMTHSMWPVIALHQICSCLPARVEKTRKTVVTFHMLNIWTEFIYTDCSMNPRIS